jgi:hypothetical protein
MPDGSEAQRVPHGAVIITLEDGLGDTVVPRLVAAGADLELIRVVQLIKGPDGIDRTPTLPVDLGAIELAIEDVGAALLVIDPLVATLSLETNSYRDQDVRRVLAPLSAMAERTGVAVVCIRHLNKTCSGNAKYRGGGSIGIIGAARASFVFAENPDEPQTFIIAANKMNLCAKPPAHKYRLAEAGALAVQWLGETSHTAQSLLSQPESGEESKAVSAAKDFLLEILAGGPLDARKAKTEARAAGISERTLIRAKDTLGVKARKVGFGTGQHWEWTLANTEGTIQ